MVINLWIGLTAAALTAWIVLLVGRGLFWRVSPRLERPDGEPTGQAPSVVAVIPARNEEQLLPVTLPAILAQDYTGPFRVVVVDDRSEDRTTAAAREVSNAVARGDRVTVVEGAPLPAGWRGKVWAMHQGVAEAPARPPARPEDRSDSGSSPTARTAEAVLAPAEPKVGSSVHSPSAARTAEVVLAPARPTAEQSEYIWFTDADITHDAWVLRALVDRAESDRLDLVSTMALLRIDGAWDRLLVPAFVYFFAKLYPFRFVANPGRRTAGAAGGCILVRRSALDRAGGLPAIRSALIDDCAFGRLIKRAGGRLWLGFSLGVRSVRGYGTLSSIWSMVARSAYTQLGHSPLKLIGTVLGMVFLYLLAPCACLGGAIAAVAGVPNGLPLVVLGGVTWGLMSLSFIPILRYHGVAPWVARLLPVAGVLYTAMTVSSAWRHARGHGGAWKGRTYSEAP